jgi:membrane protein implicated in regulation of membrane protease activity
MSWPTDGLAAFFLVCFFVGLLFTIGSFLLGLGHDAAGAHGGDAGGDAGHLHLGDHHIHLGGHGHAGAAGDQAGAGEHAAPQSGGRGQWQQGGPSFFNLSTAMAFLTWFGGAGFILRVYYGAWLLVALAAASLAGLVGGALVFLFLSRVLYASQRILDPRDYFLPGTLARVTSAIRAGGIGEIVYTKGDTRQVAGARSVDGSAIERGVEVVIMRYERGLAYVQRWDELMQTEEEQPGEPSTPVGR